MKKNWYAVHTKTQCEKKASLLLSKKGIQNFCPFNTVVLKNGSRKKIIQEPLFPSFVFVYISESEMSLVKQTNDVINFIYWLGKPALIKTAEIENINHFANSYYNIKVEKTVVNQSGMVHITNELERNNPHLRIASPQVNNIRVSLPSLGFILKAEKEMFQSEPLKYDLGNSNMLI